MRLNIDSPQIQNNDLPPELNRWFANITDQINQMFGNQIADRTPDLIGHTPAWGTGAGPYSVPVINVLAESIVTASIQSSTNLVEIQKVTATVSGFDILFSGDPGASCIINYIIFTKSWAAQGV